MSKFSSSGTQFGFISPVPAFKADFDSLLVFYAFLTKSNLFANLKAILSLYEPISILKIFLRTILHNECFEKVLIM